jgi:hypothetical protein
MDSLDNRHETTDQKVGGSSPSERAQLRGPLPDPEGAFLLLLGARLGATGTYQPPNSARLIDSAAARLVCPLLRIKWSLPGDIAVFDHGAMNDTETSLRAENAELRRLLEKHQWAGLTPIKSSGCCPECSGASPPHGHGHGPGCAIAAILAVSMPPADYL